MPGVQSPPADSFPYDDDAQAEDDDEEEVEVEEEEEDGEEEEEEEGDDAAEEEEEEEEEDKGNQSDSPDKADDDDRDDARENVKSQRDGGFGSGSSTRGDFGLDVALAETNRSVEVVVDKKDAGTVSEKNSSTNYTNPNSNSNADLSKTSILSSADGKEMVAAMQMNSFFGRKDVPHSHGETKQMDMQSGDDRTEIASRLASSGIETRSLTPGTEIKDQNKRPAIICDFYAKGWCIKGSSCRFLHVKDHQNKELPRREGEVAADCKREVQLEGLKETTQTARSPGDPLAASVGNKSLFSSQRIQPWDHIESKTSHHLPKLPKLPLLQRDESFPFSFKDIGIDRKGQNRSANDYGNRGSVFRDRLCPEYTVSSSHHFMNPSSHSRIVGDLASVQCQPPYNSLPSSLSSHPRNSSASNSLLATGTLASNQVSSWTGSLLPFSYSSLNASHLGSSSSSLLQGSSHFSGDKLKSTKRKISSNDWEPSVPFRPSFLLRSLISPPGSKYDPLRDSIELPKLGETSLRASLHSQGSSILNSSHQQDSGDVVSEPRGLACKDETMSVSSHNTNHGKDMQTAEVEVVGTSSDRKHRNLLKQENSLGSSAAKDITAAKSDGRHQRLGPRDSVDVKIDSFRQKNKMEAGHIMEGGVDKESKALRQFRAALIDSVKESLKPKWREGLLSKDAHNKIVKKAVEKVLSTLQPDQMPTSMELVMQFLASSRPKIDKLIEGYTEIYGKL
ncbi:protein FRIGIDA-ESSENTIAL 1 [Morus notabilis]|uniref:protein FRIGIDA-ESSENTIAL 1 n=1 Tax=Morus notabilis TaxID=981085 RepID=UPI000CED5599|nr:protein FRIGIDA-ESSENTIAL 1 [Morus notabilis]